MACPFFVPLEIVNDGSWPHPSRLPLGAGWTGNCRASGDEIAASEEHLREFCNLGYATACPRDWDAVRFSVAHTGRDELVLRFVCELGHAPVEFGQLIYDLRKEAWREDAADPRVRTLASRYVESYRMRQTAAAM